MGAALILLNQPKAFGGQRILVNLGQVAFIRESPEGTVLIMAVEGRANRVVVLETIDQIVKRVTGD